MAAENTKRPLWRRLVRIVSRLIGGVIVLAVVLVALLHTSCGKSFVRGRIEQRLTALVNGEVKLGSLDYGFLFSDVELGDLEIRDAAGNLAVRVGSIRAALDRRSILRGTPVVDDLAIDGLAVSIVQTADGGSNLKGLFKPSERKPLERLTIARLAIRGGVALTKPDGSTTTISELVVDGTVDARPAAQQLDAAFDRLAATVVIAKPNQPPTQLAVALSALKVARAVNADQVTTLAVDIASLAVGPLAAEGLVARAQLAGGQPRGDLEVSLAKAHVAHRKLAELTGRGVLTDDATIELAIKGPLSKLAIHGAVATRATRLAVDGTADASDLERARYDITLVGTGKTTDFNLAGLRDRRLPTVETGLRIAIVGSGIKRETVDAKLTLTVEPTKVDRVTIDGVTAVAIAKQGAIHVDEFTARGLGVTVSARGDIAADPAPGVSQSGARSLSIDGRVEVAGSPRRAIEALATAGVEVPPRIPRLERVAIAANARGKLDGDLVVDLAPLHLAIAGGAVTIGGSATLTNKKLRSANGKITLANVDIAAASRLAGRPPKLQGTLSGTIEVTRSDDGKLHAKYAASVAVRDRGVTLAARGALAPTGLTTHLDVLRGSDRSRLAVIDARLPIVDRKLVPDGAWTVKLDAEKRSLDELLAMLPEPTRQRLAERLRSEHPPGAIELHVALAGTPARPTGTVAVVGDVAALPDQPPQHVDLVAEITSSATRVTISPRGGIALGDDRDQLITIGGTIAMPSPVRGGQIDIAHARSGVALDVAVTIPDRQIDSLAKLRAKLAEFGGSLEGRIIARGSPSAPTVDARLRLHGYQLADGGVGETIVTASGDPRGVIAGTLNHAGKVSLDFTADRTNPDRITVTAKARAAETPLRPLLPAAVTAKLPTRELGKLRWDMDATVALAKRDGKLAIDSLALTGGLIVRGGSIAIPASVRSYHDLDLELRGEPDAIRLVALRARETDPPEVRAARCTQPAGCDRELMVSGAVRLDRAKPTTAELTIAAHDWLVFGTPQFGAADAPRGELDAALAIVADLAGEVLTIDVTVNDLALRNPDRIERAHFPEQSSVSGDIIYVGPDTVVGRLPVAGAPAAAAPPPAQSRRPIDAKIHIAKPIHLVNAPLDVWATGELAVTVRDHGPVTRGKLAVERGTLSLFGRDHTLLDGTLIFDEQHPKGELNLTFERKLPDVAMRHLARTSGGAGITITGSPAKQKTVLHGAANAAMLEVMAMYNAGRPTTVNRPDLPASATVQVPRGDQLFVVTFLAQALPHLLFLDRIAGWADPYQPSGAYGRITNLEAERYYADAHARVRAVVRPATPGRSSAELQWDRVLRSTDRSAIGVGLRAGDRIGGGVGVFLEWSSER